MTSPQASIIKQIVLILLDFSKAFDRVSHNKIILKVQFTLGKGQILDWITNFLTDRYQYVELNHVKSLVVPVTSGVPQGSVLAPVLFLLFVNDLPTYVNVGCRLFADDCILYKEINTHDDHITLNTALETVSMWCRDWQMHINERKSALLSLTRKKFIRLYLYH